MDHLPAQRQHLADHVTGRRVFEPVKALGEGVVKLGMRLLAGVTKHELPRDGCPRQPLDIGGQAEAGLGRAELAKRLQLAILAHRDHRHPLTEGARSAPAPGSAAPRPERHDADQPQFAGVEPEHMATLRVRVRPEQDGGGRYRDHAAARAGALTLAAPR